MMASRIFLLLLVTFTFASAWSLDRSPPQAGIADPVPTLPAVPAPGQPDSPTGTPADSRQVTQLSRTVMMELGEGVPLPAGITPGHYCLVDDHGRTALLRLTATMLPVSHAEPGVTGCESYRVERGARRWHFLRLAHTPESHQAHRPLPPSRIVP